MSRVEPDMSKINVQSRTDSTALVVVVVVAAAAAAVASEVAVVVAAVVVVAAEVVVVRGGNKYGFHYVMLHKLGIPLNQSRLAHFDIMFAVSRFQTPMKTQGTAYV